MGNIFNSMILCQLALAGCAHPQHEFSARPEATSSRDDNVSIQPITPRLFAVRAVLDPKGVERVRVTWTFVVEHGNNVVIDRVVRRYQSEGATVTEIVLGPKALERLLLPGVPGATQVMTSASNKELTAAIKMGDEYRELLSRYRKGEKATRRNFRVGESFTLLSNDQEVLPTHLRVDAIEVEVAGFVGRASFGVKQRFDVERFQQKTPLRFPARGSWTLVNGPIPGSGHYQTNRFVSQRFAYDAMRFAGPATTRTETEEGLDGYQSYGEPVFAPADGTIAIVFTGVPDSKPWEGMDKALLKADPYALAGNHVVIDHGNGEFVMLGHLKPATIMVVKGQRVEEGELIGRCGNSGNSDEPHLHIQLMDGADYLRASPLPLAFSGLSLHLASEMGRLPPAAILNGAMPTIVLWQGERQAAE